MDADALSQVWEVGTHPFSCVFVRFIKRRIRPLAPYIKRLSSTFVRLIIVRIRTITLNDNV